MPEYSELKITVKLVDEASAKLRQMRVAQSDIFHERNHQNMERIKKHHQDMERSLTKLAEGLARGYGEAAIIRFIGGIGVIGAAIDISFRLIKGSFNLINKVASDYAHLGAVAKRMSIHPADLEEIVRTIERTFPNEEREHILGYLGNFGRNIVHLVEHKEGFREGFYATLEGEDLARMAQHLAAVEAEPDTAKQLNLIIEYARGIRERRKFTPEIGEAKKNEYLARWGLPSDITEIEEMFRIATNKERKDIDEALKAAAHWNEIAGHIAEDMELIIRGVITQLMNTPWIGAALKVIAAGTGTVAEDVLQAQADKAKGKGTGLPGYFPNWWEVAALGWNPAGWLILPGLTWMRRQWEKHPEVYVPPPFGGEIAVPYPLLGTMEKQCDQFSDLTDQFKRFDALLTGEEKPIEFLGKALSTKTPSQQGKPGGPAGTFNNDLSEGSFNQIMLGGSYERNYNDVVNAAHKYNISASDFTARLANSGGAIDIDKAAEAFSKETPDTSASRYATAKETALAIASSHIGEHELQDTTKLKEYFASQGIHNVNPKTVAWCAAQVGAALVQAGIRPPIDRDTGEPSLAAGSYLKYGTHIDPGKEGEGIEAGDIGALKGKSPRTGMGALHVGQLTGATEQRKDGLYVAMVGGNQPEPGAKGPYSGEGREVNIRWFRADKLEIRRPPEPPRSTEVVDRVLIDKGLQRESEVSGSGQLDVHVKTDDNDAKVTASGSGIYKNGVSTTREVALH